MGWLLLEENQTTDVEKEQTLETEWSLNDHLISMFDYRATPVDRRTKAGVEKSLEV